VLFTIYLRKVSPIYRSAILLASIVNNTTSFTHTQIERERERERERDGLTGNEVRP